MRNIVHILLGLSLSTAAAAASLPTTIYLDNQTSYTMDGYTAGQPGVSLEAYAASVGVPYLGVIARCNMANMGKACPVEFYNRDTHEIMASVYIDVWSGSITHQPTLYGKYAQEISVLGWENKPLGHITIKQNA